MAAIVIPVMGEVARIKRENIRYRLDSGRKRFVAGGGKLGRPKGTGLSAEQILEKYPGVARRMAENAKLEDVSDSTVKKVKRALQS